MLDATTKAAEKTLIILLAWTPTFFVEASISDQVRRWLLLAELAIKTDNFTLDLTKVPDAVMPMLIKKRDEIIKQMNEDAKKLR